MEYLKHIFSAKNIFLVLALIPVIALGLIIINLVAGSVLAIDYLGLGLFKNAFIPSAESPILIPNITSPDLPGTSIPMPADQMNYGILPALWGTVLVVGISIAIAFPISLALAVLTNEYAKGFFSSALRWVIGILSGIPPVIYAMIGGTLYLWFMWPKLAGKGLTGDALPPSNLLPSDQSATLLGAMLLALLVIPFLTPLLDDAIHSVPKALKEASLGLGATRWKTLTSVTIPYAMPGLLSGLLLGILTALGEAIIVAYTIGFGARALPVPIYDVLERTAPLTSVIAFLGGGGFSFSQVVGPVGRSTASVMGLFLVLIAFVILGLVTYLRHRLARKLA